MTEHRRILVVDDEPQITRVLRTSLSSHAYDVLDAQHGRARTHPKTKNYDQGPDCCALGSWGRTNQGAGARRGRRRLRDEALRYGGVVSAGSRGAAASAPGWRSRTVQDRGGRFSHRPSSAQGNGSRKSSSSHAKGI